MRLLHTPTLNLESKRDDDIPAYAILPHTWGQDHEEVTLQDLQLLLAAQSKDPNGWTANPLAQRPGFIKIQGAAKLALSEGYGYIWIDTCCIDKTSSAELSEAINSMFRWYKESNVCYVYLSDINDPPGQNSLEGMSSKIGTSRWFTRGWTLQELIAPTDLRFYSKDWSFLGSKNTESLLQNISLITGIDKDALSGFYELENFSVSARMKWASHRKTSRIEDIAYCLMGIFQVNMPLLYGEGTKAFIRLQEEILRGNDDQTLFAWKCPKDDPLSDQPSGLLAKSPLWFKDSGNLRALSVNSDVFKSTPSSMTNSGLYIQLSLIDMAQLTPESNKRRVTGLFVAILHCSPYSHPDQKQETIYKAALKLQHLGGDRYVRVECDSIFDVDSSLLRQLSTDGYEYVYVKQNPVIPLPDISIDDRRLSNISHLQYRITPVWSLKGQWDETIKRLRCNKPGPNGVLCVFRYTLEYLNIGQWTIDVAVGLYSQTFKVGPQSCWCFQRPASRSQGDGSWYPPSDVSLSNKHEYYGVTATVQLQEEDKKSTVLTLTLKTFDNWILPTLTKGLHVILPVDSIPDETRTRDYLHTCCSSQTQPDVFRIGEFNNKNVRVKSSCTSENEVASKLKSDLAKVKPAQILTKASSKSPPSTVGQNENLRRLVKACLQGRPEKVNQVLSESGISFIMTYVTMHGPIWTEGFRLIHWAVATGHEEIIQTVVNYDRNLQTRFLPAEPRQMMHKEYKAVGWITSIHLAVMLGDLSTLKILLKDSEQKWAEILLQEKSTSYSDLHPRDSPMHIAASHLHSPLVEKVFDCLRGVFQYYGDDAQSDWANCDVNTFGETPHHRAAAMNNRDALLAILERLSNMKEIEHRDRKKRTPLWHAAAADAYDPLLILLERNADANSADMNGMTVLEIACRFARPEIVKALLARGANPNTCTIIQSTPGTGIVRMTPFIYAALRGNPSTLYVLLNAGAKPDGTGESALTPLHVAAANGHLQFVRILCEAQHKNELSKWLDAGTSYILRVMNTSGDMDVQIFRQGNEMSARKLAEMCGQTETANYLRMIRGQ